MTVGLEEQLAEWQARQEERDAQLLERLTRLEQGDRPPLSAASVRDTMRNGYAQEAERRERERQADTEPEDGAA